MFLDIWDFLSTEGFQPHGMCLLWRPDVFWSQVGADLVIALSYFSIPAALVYFAMRRSDLVYRWVLHLFGGFIVACGLTHVFNIWTMWIPDYGVEAVVKTVTALVSLGTAIALWPLMPKLLAVPSPRQIEEKNIALAQEVSVRKSAEAELKGLNEQLRESEENYRLLVESSPDPIFVTADGVIVFANAAAVSKFGAESDWDLIGRRSIEHVHSGDRSRILQRRAQSVAQRRAHPFEQARHLRLDGSEFTSESTSTPIVWEGEDALMIVIRDITDRIRADEEKTALEVRLRQAQKMESLGTLAGGTAHEFNNMLTPIMALTELAMKEIPEAGRAHDNLARVLDSARRAAQLVEKILSFSHADDAKLHPVDLRDVVAEVVDLLQATLPSTITVRIEADEMDQLVLADATQIHQVIVNLASNASQAMDGGVGELTIRLDGVVLDQGLDRKTGKLVPGSYARLRVSDTGHGMDTQTMERIFEPFFTTKDVGEGTGLGLAMIHGIVTAHGGAIEVESEPGRGTTFTIYLPHLTQQDEAAALAG